MTISTPLVSDRLVERTDYAIIGPTDGRYRVRSPVPPPYDAVCHIERDFGGARFSGCTAFLIGPRLLLTAGHCLYSLVRGRPPTRIRVSPGRNGAGRPAGSQFAEAWFAHPRFIERGDPRYDFGVIRLKRPFPGLRPFRVTAASTPALRRIRQTKLIRIAGYPSDKPRGQMWAHAERLDGIGRTLLNYSVDTCPGVSGAPVWIGDGQVIAIHTRGPKPSARGPWGCRPGAPFAPASHFNAGVRINPGLLASVESASSGRGPLRKLSP